MPSSELTADTGSRAAPPVSGNRLLADFDVRAALLSHNSATWHLNLMKSMLQWYHIFSSVGTFINKNEEEIFQELVQLTSYLKLKRPIFIQRREINLQSKRQFCLHG